MFGYSTLILVGFFVCIYGSIRSILLLIEFGKEDRAVIEEEATRRAEGQRASILQEHVLRSLQGDGEACLLGISHDAELRRRFSRFGALFATRREDLFCEDALRGFAPQEKGDRRS